MPNFCSNDELSWLFTNRFGATENFNLRRIWLPTQFIVELNSSFRQKLGTLNFHLLKNLKILFIIFSIRGGELFDRVIEDEFVLTEKACVCFMRQVLEGVSFIHSKHILHLDLKVRHSTFFKFIQNTDLG